MFSRRCLPRTFFESFEIYSTDTLNDHSGNIKTKTVNKIILKDKIEIAEISDISNTEEEEEDQESEELNTDKTKLNPTPKQLQYTDPKCPKNITVGGYVRKNNKIFLPERMLSLVCLCLHKERNHPGAQGLFKIIKSLCYLDRFAGLQRIYQAIANNCTICLLNKPGHSKYHRRRSRRIQ